VLPADLQAAIDAETSSISLRDVRAAVADLSDIYRPARAGAPPAPIRLTQAQRLAYLVARMPATYAATRAVFAEIRRRCPALETPSLLDLGAGPGTALWAARETWPGLASVRLIERDAAMAQLGERLWARAEANAPAPQRVITDVRSLPPDLSADVVVLSYVVGELGSDATSVLSRAWRATRTMLAIVEPGTPDGSAAILRARDQLVGLGGHVVAPCPHDGRCPLPANDWCHFTVRLPRTARHRQAKDADLGWEDEKFAYVVLARESGAPATARVIRHPIYRKGHVALRLCTRSGIADEAVSKREGSRYHAARHASWGDAWEKEGPG
jgi:ribosomal protein RSM22 (predicted rRNA methylase)